VIGTRVLADGRLKVSRTWESAVGLDGRGSERDGSSSFGRRSPEDVDHDGKICCYKYVEDVELSSKGLYCFWFVEIIS